MVESKAGQGISMTSLEHHVVPESKEVLKKYDGVMKRGCIIISWEKTGKIK